MRGPEIFSDLIVPVPKLPSQPPRSVCKIRHQRPDCSTHGGTIISTESLVCIGCYAMGVYFRSLMKFSTISITCWFKFSLSIAIVLAVPARAIKNEPFMTVAVLNLISVNP